MNKPYDVTTDPVWIEQNTDRLLNWELLCGALKGIAYESYDEMKPFEMYDRIGLRPHAIKLAIRSAKNNLNAK